MYRNKATVPGFRSPRFTINGLPVIGTSANVTDIHMTESPILVRKLMFRGSIQRKKNERGCAAVVGLAVFKIKTLHSSQKKKPATKNKPKNKPKKKKTNE